MNVNLTSDLKYLIERNINKMNIPRELPESKIAKAEAWINCNGKNIPHQEWKGELCKAVLNDLKIDIDPKEKLVGNLYFHAPTDIQVKKLEDLKKVFDEITPFPGGDDGHFHPDFERIFKLGLRGYIDLVKSYLSNESDKKKISFYTSCISSLEGVRIYIENTISACYDKNMVDTAKVCENLLLNPPKTFREALQLMLFIIIALWYGASYSTTCPGRMDQTLIKFYEKDIENGILTKQEAFELICNLYIHLNNIIDAGTAIAVIVGGRDKNENIICNDLTYLCIEAKIQTSLVYPTVGIAWHDGMPDELMLYAAKAITCGVGDPAIFNDQVVVDGLMEYGVTKEDALNWMNSTCVEIKPVGASNIWTPFPYFNCSQILLDIIKDIKDNKLTTPNNLDELNNLIENSFKIIVKKAAENNEIIWNKRKETGLSPLASCFTNDCLEKGCDLDNGGARYNWIDNSFVGMANLSDALYVINKLIFLEKRFDFANLYSILEKDYVGYEELLAEINAMPKYGNDDDSVDNISTYWFSKIVEISRLNKIDGYEYVPGAFCFVIHELLGGETMATPDGRCAGFPFADGAGSAQGRDVNGPTSSILSTTKWDHKEMMGGIVQNIKFSKSNFNKESDYEALKNLIITYLKRGGFEIQVNMTSKEELLDAQKHPERYKNLIVRVAGYSDYFIHLSPNMQKEVIARTEHIL